MSCPVPTFEPTDHPHPRSRQLTRWLALAALAMASGPPIHAGQAFQGGMPPKTESVLAVPLVMADKRVLAAPADVRWQSSLAAFAKADQAQYPASGGVVFVGSSSIRLWPHLEDDFRQQPAVLNRGFGGSTLADCHALVRELVIQYKPRQVVLYAGDNDLAEGHSPAEVLASFASFVQSVRAGLPGARITYISIKPSPLRLSLLPRIRETNALIANYMQTLAEVSYIDIFSPMLNAEGLPRPELFQNDRLHLNQAGYQLWQSVIAPYLPAPLPTPKRPAASGSS